MSRGARTLALARQAVALAPGSSWAQYALALAYWFTGDVGRGLEALETGRALNPNDTTIIADLGQRYAMLARLGPGGAAARRRPSPATRRSRAPIASACFSTTMPTAASRRRSPRPATSAPSTWSTAGSPSPPPRQSSGASARPLPPSTPSSRSTREYGERVVDGSAGAPPRPGVAARGRGGLRLAGLPGIDAGPCLGHRRSGSRHGHGNCEGRCTNRQLHPLPRQRRRERATACGLQTGRE